MAKSIMAMMAKIQSAPRPPQHVEEIKEPDEKEKKFIKLLHVSMEFGMPGVPGTVAVGGIGSVVYSLCQAQKVHEHFIDARVIIPYYEALHKDLTDFEEIQEIHHLYADQSVRSMILKKITDEGIVQYFVKPLEPIGIQLFNDIHIPELIYSNGWNGSKFIERISYFSSAVSEFSCTGEPLFKPNIVQGHGWALSFLGKLIRKRREENLEEKPYTVYVVHSIHDGDGIFLANEVPILKQNRNSAEPIRLTEEIMDNGYDHIVYVSEQLLKESILNPNYETISNFVLDAYKSSKTSAILNNICTEKFDPSKCLPDEFKFDLNDIHSGKERIKNHLNNGLLKEIGKAINLYAPMVLYVGRYSDEKGIEKFDSAIQLILKNNGTFFSMGTGDPSLIQCLIDKYQHEKSVIFFTTKEEQVAYGTLVRSAADIFLIPSKIESCGLVPMEANTAGAIVVASRIGGLINVIVPDANGALFEFDRNFEEVLQNVLNSFVELIRTGNLNAVLKLIQESAVKSYDWNSKYAGSTFSYFNLYCRLGNEEEMQKKLIEQETIFTHALITNNEPAIESILNSKSRAFFLPNKVGLTPSELASRMNRHDLEYRINEIIYSRVNKESLLEPLVYRKKRIILNVCLEYKQIKLGGVGSFITSFVDAINFDDTHYTECRVIMPHYPWHDELINENFLNPKRTYEVNHLYNNEMIQSTVTTVENGGIIQYLIRPNSDELHEALYGEIKKNEANYIFHNSAPKTAYFNSAVAAFIAYSGLRINITLAHGWGCALTARLLKEREKYHHTKTIQVVHSELSEQGVVLNNDPNFYYLNGIGLNFNDQLHISPLKEGISHSDKTVYVSQTLLNQAISYVGYFHFNDIVREHNKNGKLLGILNGIDEEFHPCKLTGNGDYWDKDDSISKNKYIAKQRTCTLITDALLSDETSETEKDIFRYKNLDCDKNWTLFIGRFSEEKGINRLEDAIECTLENANVFIVMGLYSGGPEDRTIEWLSEKYRNNPNVIILHEKNYHIQKKYGHLIRFASDITFIPSHRESAGLVSLEAQLNSNFVISSNVGGLNDSVIPYKTGLKYDNFDPIPYKAMKKTITDGNQFISDLKNNRHADYELFLTSLYETSIQKYLFSSPDGPTNHYLDLFDSLCYFHPITERMVPKIPPIEDEEKAFIEEIEFEITTNAGDEIALFYAQDDNLDIKNDHRKILPKAKSDNFLIGKLTNSEKHSDKIGKFMVVKKQNTTGLMQKQINTLMHEYEILHKMNFLELPYPYITGSPEIYFFLKPYKWCPLDSFLPESPHTSLCQKLSHVEQLMQFLKKMHHRNILHLDINENNIVLEEQVIEDKSYLNARLLDFSSSKMIQDGKSRVKIDSFNENAPIESLSGYACKATDIHALGLFIFKYLFNPTADCFLNKNPLLGIRHDLNHVVISNFNNKSNLSNKESYVLWEIKKMIIDMIARNENYRVPIDYCIDKIQNACQILSYPEQRPEFSLEEYCRSAGFRSFDMENPQLLEHACKNNYFEIVKIILSNSNQKDYFLSHSNDMDLLTQVVQHSDLALIKFLLTHDFFGWVTVDGMIDFINRINETKIEKKDILGLFCVYLFSKEHGFKLSNLCSYNEEGHTPFSKLLLTNDWNGESEFLVEQLSTHGANINQKTLYNLDALYFLTHNNGIRNAPDVLVKLVKNGFIINEEHLNYKGQVNESLYLKIKVLNFLQSKKISGNHPSSTCFHSAHTALTLAAENADNEIISSLLDFYIQEHQFINKSLILNYKNQLGRTPLHTAISKGNFFTTYFLIENGADIHIKDPFGQTSIDLINNHHNTTDASAVLSRINSYFQRKFYSINIGNVLDKLIYYFQEKNFSALYLSSLNNVEKLTDIMRNRFLKAIINQNPSQAEIIQLVDMGFSLNYPDETGCSFLQWAEDNEPYLTKNLFLKEIDFLNQHRFHLYDIDDINDTGHTPLSYAVFIQDMDLIKTLLNTFHANINSRNGVGNTALHLSVDTRNVEIVNFLLSNGGDMAAVNNDGLSPESLAWGNAFPEVTDCFDQFKRDEQSEIIEPIEEKGSERRIKSWSIP